MQTGLGIAVNNGTVALTHPDYNDSAAQYVNPTTASGNQFAEQLQLYDVNGNQYTSRSAAI